MTALAPLVRRYRIRAALSQNALARQAGIDPAYLNRIEKQDTSPSRRVILDLGRVLGLGVIEQDRLLIASGHCPQIIAEMSDRQLSALYALMGNDGVEPTRLGAAS